MSSHSVGAPDPVRILQVTDPHLFEDDAGELRGVVTARSLADVLDDYLRADWRADLVLATGDIVQDDTVGAYRRFAEAMASVKLPVFCVPGNHDIRTVMKAEAERSGFHYCTGSRAGGWLLAGIDSCAEGRAGGRVSESELERLAGMLRASSAEHVLVYLHHPPVAMHSRWLDEVGLENGPEFLRTLQADERVALVLFGHVHQAYDEAHGQVRVLGTPSTCRQFAPRRDTFAVDDRPPAYRRIELDQNGSIHSELCWVDAA